MTKKGFREIEWGPLGTDRDKTCIYDNGHIDPATFLRNLRMWSNCSFDAQDLSELKESDVEHVRFRPMSPSEAREKDCDHGVMETSEGGYPVTRVVL